MSAQPVLSVNAFRHICRTCLKTKDLFFIHDVRWDDLNLRKLLGNWISFEETYEHEMPQQICKSCLMSMVNIQLFVTQIQKSQETLKDGLHYESLCRMITIPELKEEEFLDFPIKHETIEIRIEKGDDDQDSDHGFNLHDNDFYNESATEDQNIPKKTDIVHARPKRQTNNTSRFMEEINEQKTEIEAIRKVVTATQKCVEMQKGESKPIVGRDLIYFCGVCQNGFHTHQEFKMHKKMENHFKGGSSFYICPHCKKKLSLHSQLKEHFVKHRNEKPNLCSQCGKAFTAKSDLSRHIRNVHLKRKSLKCKFCYKLFSKVDAMKEHEATHENMVYICSFCGKDFKYYQYWATHERSHRKDVMRKKYEYKVIKREFQCSNCGKIYYTKQAFEEHIKEHEGAKYPCEICDKEFPTEGKLKKHKDFVHTDGKYTCDICGHTVKQKPNLENHIKTVHKGEKTEYKCENCEKVFYNKNSYKLHMRIHTNDTKYQCKICLRICTTKRNLETHMRVHTGERPFECTHCGKKFAAKENLGVHMKTHAGPPTCVCPLCPRAFYTNGVLRKHIQNVHNKAKKKVTTKRGSSKVSKNVANYNDSIEIDDSDNEDTKHFSGVARKAEKFLWFH